MIWTKEEKGWYTSSLGGIVKERGDRYFKVKAGWYWWPVDGNIPKAGPFNSLEKAKEYAEFKR